jgi:hypothetical protein
MTAARRLLQITSYGDCFLWRLLLDWLGRSSINGIGLPLKVGFAPPRFVHSDHFIGFVDCHDQFILTSLSCQLLILNYCFKSISFEFAKPLFAILRQSNVSPTAPCGSMRSLPASAMIVVVFEGLKNDYGKCLGLESTKQEKRVCLVRKQDPVWLRGLFIPRLAVHVDLFRLRGGSKAGLVIEDVRLVDYRGSSPSVVILKTIEVLGDSCFKGCQTLTSIAFESES